MKVSFGGKEISARVPVYKDLTHWMVMTIVCHFIIETDCMDRSNTFLKYWTDDHYVKESPMVAS